MVIKVKVTSIFLTIALTAALLTTACGGDTSKGSVVVYTSVDQVFSEPILKQFEEESGINVLPVFDVEAVKTTGLVNRLIAEKDRPQCDVFWNGEFAQTILLKEEGVLAPYLSPNADSIPEQYIDPDGYWIGFGGRARVMLVNTDLVSPSDYPESIFDMLDSAWSANRIGIAYPLFGTTATQAAALYAALGPEAGRAFFQDLYDHGVRVVDGNSVVRDLVASGKLIMGLTDTDDACGALSRGAPVAIVFPDQDGLGTLIIPNTVALIAGAPHPTEAKMLIDYLLSTEVEGRLIESGWSQVPLRPSGIQPSYLQGADVKGMNVSLAQVFGQLRLAKEELAEIFIR
ncbi:extracellular solute-binding protein [Chloroflexota bacterium]